MQDTSVEKYIKTINSYKLKISAAHLIACLYATKFVFYSFYISFFLFNNVWVLVFALGTIGYLY